VAFVLAVSPLCACQAHSVLAVKILPGAGETVRTEFTRLFVFTKESTMPYLKVTDFSDQEHICGPYESIVWEGDHLYSETGALLIELTIDDHTGDGTYRTEAWCPLVEAGFYVSHFAIVSSVPDWAERAEAKQGVPH